jgi:hypothetical protein
MRGGELTPGHPPRPAHGEREALDGKIADIAVSISARISGLAAGEVLVPQTAAPALWAGCSLGRPASPACRSRGTRAREGAF